MGAQPTGAAEDEIRTAEVIGSLSLATDLAMGFPFEHGLHSTLLADRIARRLGVEEDARRDIFFGCLLFYAGCTVDSDTAALRFPPGGLTTWSAAGPTGA